MATWFVVLALLTAGVAVVFAYRVAAAGGERTATPVLFHAVLPVSEPVAPDGRRTLGPLSVGEQVVVEDAPDRPVVTMTEGLVHIAIGTHGWSVPVTAFLDAAAGQPESGGLPLDLTIADTDGESDAQAIVYEVRGIAGGQSPKLDAAMFWLIVPETVLQSKVR
jgi:hypothetical protein